MNWIPDQKSRLLFAWSVFFFSLFGSIPVLVSHSAAGFFLAWLKNACLWCLLASAGAAAVRFAKRQGWLESVSKKADGRRFFWIVFILLLLCSLPAFLAFFPGTIGADAPKQLAAYDGVLPLTRHHPIVHTLIAGWLFDLGGLIFQSGNGGAALYTSFQIVFCNYAMARTLLYLRQRQVPLWLLLILLVFFGCNPLVQILLCYSTKDIPYAAALLLFVVDGLRFLYPAADDHPAASLAGMTFWGILMCLLRNQGTYMIVLVLIAMLLVWGKKIRKRKNILWAGAQTAVLLVSLLIGSWMPGAFGIPAGDVREMLSVPSQQIARTIVQSENPESSLLTQTQKELASSYFDNFDPLAYDRFSADPNKDVLITSRIKENPLQFLQVWMNSLFSDFPGAVYAWTDLIAPYFGNEVSGYFTGLNTLYSYEQYLQPRNIHSQPVLPSLRESYAQLTTVPMQHQLGWKIVLFLPQVSLYVLIYLLGYGWIRQRPACLYAVSFGFVYFLSLLLGPVALSRYLFVLMMQVPLWIGILNIEAHKNPAPEARTQ